MNGYVARYEVDKRVEVNYWNKDSSPQVDSHILSVTMAMRTGWWLGKYLRIEACTRT